MFGVKSLSSRGAEMKDKTRSCYEVPSETTATQLSRSARVVQAECR